MRGMETKGGGKIMCEYVWAAACTYEDLFLARQGEVETHLYCSFSLAKNECDSHDERKLFISTTTATASSAGATAAASAASAPSVWQ